MNTPEKGHELGSFSATVAANAEAGLEDAWEGHNFITLYCNHCGYEHDVMLRCGDRTCPVCRENEFYRLFDGYKVAIEGKIGLKSVTLTLKNVPQGGLEGTIDRLRASFNTLRRREPYATLWKGGIYALEIVNKGRGWNVHAHLIIEGAYIPQKTLSADWLSITGDSRIVDIRYVRKAEGALWHMLKYVMKPPTVGSSENKAEYNRVLKGRRLIHAWGTWWGQFVLANTSVFLCPRCGNPHWMSEFELRKLNLWAQPVAPRAPPMSEELPSYKKPSPTQGDSLWD
ncbi:unnamed protein product [marine sediment metagenome]|uniref:Replication protein n=1 Tax=marine sediment metagenome TaxID=412755 RepID=X1JM61_9ZZZZ